MNKKWTLVLMGGFAFCLAFVTFSSILSGCAGQVPSATTYVLTSTPTRTPTP
jgi:hypothetical protein